MKKFITVIMLLAVLGSVQGEPRKRHESKNYIYRRQQIGAVQGTPIRRLQIGRRQIDIYRNGLMFEKDSVVGVEK